MNDATTRRGRPMRCIAPASAAASAIVLPAVFLTLLATAPFGCSREFSSPPPEVSIVGFEPTHGYLGDRVVLCGRNFAPEAENNIVYFGTAVAEVDTTSTDPDPTPQCAHERLAVQVPALQVGDRVLVKVSTPNGQAVSVDTFVYDGPGHPVAEELDGAIDARSAPVAVFTLPANAADRFGVIGAESRMMSIVDQESGLHLDFGLCQLPFSAAIAATGALEFAVFTTTLRITSEQGLGVEVDLKRWRMAITAGQALELDPPEPVQLPATTDQKPFLPSRLWSFVRPEQSHQWTEHDLAVGHLTRPALALVQLQPSFDVRVVELPDQPPYCKQHPGDRLGPILDLVYDRQRQQFYAALEDSNEVWRISFTGESQRVWPPPQPDSVEAHCDFINCALAMRRSSDEHEHLRLYVCDRNSRRVQEMRLEQTAEGEHLMPTERARALDGAPYAMTTGRFPSGPDGASVVGERLYVATGDGLAIVDVSARDPADPGSIDFRFVGEIPQATGRGGPQSLAVIEQLSLADGEADAILFTDTADDRLLLFASDDQGVNLRDLSIGGSFPQLATSKADNRLYWSDPLANVVQLVDPHTGVRLGQLPIADLADETGFGSVGMTALSRDEHDLLLVPLVEPDEDTERRSAFQRLSYRFLPTGTQPPDCATAEGGLPVETSVRWRFHEMHLVSWSDPTLVFTRYFEQTRDKTGQERSYSGRTWCQRLRPEAIDSGDIVPDEQPLYDLGEHGPEVLLVRPSRRSPVIARLESARSDVHTSSLTLRVFDLERPELPAQRMVSQLPAELTSGITDLAVLRRQDDAQLAYQVYLPLSNLGQILVVTLRPEATEVSAADSRRAIHTGAAPDGLFASPDDRRIYATHLSAAKVSVIRTDCAPVGGCESVLSTIEVSDWPARVLFEDSGRLAYVTHLFSSHVSVID